MSKPTQVTNVSCLKIPIEYMDFIERNPRIAQAVGTGIVSLIEIQEAAKKIEDMIQDTNYYVKLLDYGTVEQLKGFLKAAVEAQKKGTARINNVSQEDLEEIREKLGSYGAIETVLGS